uniref:CSON000690 protein n=1 Tax=Culicoides sonorensis TaxID=179676 RepID=A0A336MKM2_CULSO
MNNGRYSSEDDSKSQCCLIDENGVRCKKTSGNAAYSKRIQKTVTQKKLRLSIDTQARHLYICDSHKAKIQSARTKKRRKDSEDDSNETDTTDYPDVDLYSLQVNTLRRYKKTYKVPTRPGMNKAQLADTIMKHFKTLAVKEKETLTYFIYMVKTNANKLEQKNGINNDAI